MRVLKLNLVPVFGEKNFLQATAEVVDMPFSWVVDNQVYQIPDDIDPGPIEAMSIPLPLFENWKEFGRDANDKSVVIPEHIDLDSTGDAHRELRLFGTLDVVESLSRNEFKSGDQGMLAYLQFLLRCNYVTREADFHSHLLPCAKKKLTTWDKKSIYSFCSRALGKKSGNVSLADVAHVVMTISGNPVELSAKDFDTMAVAQMMPIDKAAEARPDEFFMAAYPEEIMEAQILRNLMVETEEGLFFAKGTEHPKHWIVKGPAGVKWKVSICNHMASWAPASGTMYDKAEESKKVMFPSLNAEIPFDTVLKDNKVLDSGAFEMKPGDITTGLRFLSVDQELKIYKLVLVPSDVDSVAKELNKVVGTNLPNQASEDDVVAELRGLYASWAPTIEAAFGDRHFMVSTEGLAKLGSNVCMIEKMRALETNSDVERIDVHLLPGKPALVRSIMTMVWLLKHMMSESLCYREADNDDFTVDAAVEYVVDKIFTEKDKTMTVFLINCTYSEPFGGRKKGVMDFKGIDKSVDFNIL